MLLTTRGGLVRKAQERPLVWSQGGLLVEGLWVGFTQKQTWSQGVKRNGLVKGKLARG